MVPDLGSDSAGESLSLAINRDIKGLTRIRRNNRKILRYANLATPSGVGDGRKPPRYLGDGDTVTCSVESLGELTNPCKMISE